MMFLPTKEHKVNDKEKIDCLVKALRQMFAAFDSPIAMRRMRDDFSNESRIYAREQFEAAGFSVYGYFNESSKKDER